jgi:hypothetical protein
MGLAVAAEACNTVLCDHLDALAAPAFDLETDASARARGQAKRSCALMPR